MSRATRIRIVSQPLLASPTRAQVVMACDVRTLYAAAATIAAGAALTDAQSRAIEEACQVMAHVAPVTIPAEDRLRLAESVSALADEAAVEQRGLVAATLANALTAEDWTVTVVEGGPPDRCTGIEATRGTEHLIAAVGTGELLADQAGAHDGDAAVEEIVAGLQAIGWATVIAEVSQDRTSGSLYALPGGPTRAHAVQVSLRHDANRPQPARRRSALRITTG